MGRIQIQESLPFALHDLSSYDSVRLSSYCDTRTSGCLTVLIPEYINGKTTPFIPIIQEGNMITKKQNKKSGDLCRVIFKVPREACMGAKSIMVVGDFNNWSVKDNPMKKLKNGAFTLELDLESNKEYQFRYLIDEKIWENDWAADRYVRSEYGNCENSVVVV